MFTRDVKVIKVGEIDDIMVYKDVNGVTYHVHADGSITDPEGVGENVELVIVDDFASSATIA